MSGDARKDEQVPLPDLAINAVSIVVRGPYNPAIFSPSWLKANDLIGSAEYDSAKVEVISPALSVIEADWLRLQATNDSLILSTSDSAQFERARDAAVGILQALRSIPISVMGINREVHFRAKTEKQWHKIGDALAPKGPWKDLIKSPGLLDVSILGYRGDLYSGRVQVSVQPSVKVAQGVYVTHNDHYDLKVLDSPQSLPERFSVADIEQKLPEPEIDRVSAAIEILGIEWENSMERAEIIIAKIAQLGTVRS